LTLQFDSIEDILLVGVPDLAEELAIAVGPFLNAPWKRFAFVRNDNSGPVISNAVRDLPERIRPFS
jgi:hypothetical protein